MTAAEWDGKTGPVALATRDLDGRYHRIYCTTPTERTALLTAKKRAQELFCELLEKEYDGRCVKEAGP